MKHTRLTFAAFVVLMVGLGSSDSLRGIFSNLRHLIFGRKGYTVLLGGKRCRVLGHIGMLHTVVDVTNVNCKLGDKAVFDVNPLMLKGVDVVFQ